MLNPSSEAFGRRSGQLEQWRTRLIDDNDAMKSFLDEYPNVDRQQLRNMVRNAQKEMHSEPPKPGTSYKKLFQMIKEIVPAE
jgi:ribosome-associated protein